MADALVHGVGGGDPDWAVVAGHYEQAQQFDEAAQAHQQAAAAARGRGALAEARTYLSLALAGLDRTTPGLARDGREITLRLERGFLAAAVEGYQTRTAASDFERCLELCQTGLRDDAVIVSLFALAGYYALRGDLRQADHVLESLAANAGEGRRWLRPVLEVGFGVVEWLRGQIGAAGSRLERAMKSLTAADRHEIDAVWIQPDEPVASAHVYLALVRLMRGDLPGAVAELAEVANRAEGLVFPQAPYVRAAACYMEIWLRIEAGQLDTAASLAADLIERAERHGFDAFRALGSAQQATVSALAALDAKEVDTSGLSAHISTVSGFADTLHTVGMHAFAMFFDGVAARLLTCAGQPERARQRLDTVLALTRETGMHFYDAELLRLRAHTHNDPDAGRADFEAARELARRQGAQLFELRAALADFEHRGEPARAPLVDAVNRFHATSSFPEVARAQHALEFFGNRPGKSGHRWQRQEPASVEEPT